MSLLSLVISLVASPSGLYVVIVLLPLNALLCFWGRKAKELLFPWGSLKIMECFIIHGSELICYYLMASPSLPVSYSFRIGLKDNSHFDDEDVSVNTYFLSKCPRAPQSLRSVKIKGIVSGLLQGPLICGRMADSPIGHLIALTPALKSQLVLKSIPEQKFFFSLTLSHLIGSH